MAGSYFSFLTSISYSFLALSTMLFVVVSVQLGSIIQSNQNMFGVWSAESLLKKKEQLRVAIVIPYGPLITKGL